MKKETMEKEAWSTKANTEHFRNRKPHATLKIYLLIIVRANIYVIESTLKINLTSYPSLFYS